MSQHKFFSGLPPKMEGRTKSVINRQQTQFYWPEDSNKPVTPNRRMSRSSSKDSGGTNWDASNYDTDVAKEAMRERRNQQLQSRIEFYDVPVEAPKKKVLDENQNDVTKSQEHRDGKVNGTENKEVNGKHANGSGDKGDEKNVENTKETTNNRKSIENLVERVHEVHLDESVSMKGSRRPNDYDSYDSDDEYQRERRRPIKKIPSRTGKRQDSWEEYENREIRRPPPSRRPPRSNYDYEDEVYAPNRSMSRERYRREYFDEYDSRPIARPPPSPRRYVDDGPPDDRYYEGPPAPRRYVMDTDYEPIDRDFYYEEPPQDSRPPTPSRQKVTQKITQKVGQNGTVSPGKRTPVKRAMSICSDCPSEISRAMSQRHLKSNIFFTDKEALTTNPRPRTVRDSAVNRVCVGLPDIE